MSENDELLARIGQLAGQINRAKTQSSQPQGASSHYSHYVARHAPNHHGWAPYSRGRGRRGAPHRNRTLVLNNSGPAAGKTSSPIPSDNDNESRPAPTSNGWVAKRDRHMQLINSAVYDKEKLIRAKAMEETRKAKVKQRAEREQSKVLRFAQNATNDASVSTATQQIIVNDIPFKITRGGSKLVRISNDPQTANATPKKATVAGVSFIRSKNGNLLRLGVVTSKKPITAKKKDELCKRFSTTGIVFSDGLNPSAKPLEISKLTYSLGTCYKGPSCLYTHDPSKVAICKDFLQAGQCSSGNSCDLSHEPSPHRSPTCMHFLRERCSNPECRYAHIRVTPGAPVCRAFANLGYCEKGAKCEERHVHECPDYANDGVCHKKRCQLPHVDRAGQIRKAAAAAASKAEREDESDQSSEEEEYDAIDDDDVDSDEFDDVSEELVEGIDSGEMEQQQDFVRF